MFRRKAPNLEEVKTKLITLLTSVITQYNQQVQVNPPLKKVPFTSHVDMIPTESFSPQVRQILTKDVIDLMSKDQAALRTMLGQDVLQLPLAVLDLYFLTLSIVAQADNKQELRVGILTVASSFHATIASSLIQKGMFIETITEVNNALALMQREELPNSNKMSCAYLLGICSLGLERPEKAKEYFHSVLSEYNRISQTPSAKSEPVKAMVQEAQSYLQKL